MSETERTLTGEIGRGDSEALARFYRQWFDHVYAHARRCTRRDEQFCLDVVQEVMLRVIRFAKPIENEAATARWLQAVTFSCCLDALRRERRRTRREQTLDKSDLRSDRDCLNDDIQWLGVQLAALEPDIARLLTFRFRFGWTLQRIASAVGLTPGAVDGRIGRALAHLKAQAGEHSNE